MNPETLSREAAQRRADDIAVFRAELARVQAEGALALSEEQQRGLSAHHDGLLASLAASFDIDADSRAKQLSLGMRIVSFLGALALAASVFFLFHRFWGVFGETTQVAILVAAAAGSFALPFAIRARDDSGYFAKLAAMVAFACFVLDLSMLGAIFNVAPTDAALLPWGALAFLLAYTFDLRLLLVAGIACAVAYVAARTGTWSGMYWLDLGRRPENFFLPGLLLFALPQFADHRRYPGFAPTYRIAGLLSVFLPVLVLANWGQASYLDLPTSLVEGAYQLAGFGGSALVVWLGARRRWPDVVNTGVTLFALFLYTKFFDWWWDAMPKYLFFLVLGLTAVLFLVVFRRLRAALARHPEGGES